ncbi:hypothetical protein [Euzebya sp.]|uniref:hypothetical protein n=1 Tax=Euzebya sp. TaxID=1971409 RepID=UPI003516F822
MPLLVLLLVVVIVLVIYSRRQDRANAPIVVPAPNRPAPPRHQRVTDRELAQRVESLKQAIEAETIPHEDAVASLVRTCGVEWDVARSLLSD